MYKTYTLSDICYSLKYNFLCISALNLGVSYYLRKSERNVTAEQISFFYSHNNRETSVNVKWLEKLLYLCLFSVLVYTTYQLVLRQTMSYHELYESRELNSYLLIFGSVALGLFFIFIKRHVKLIIGCWLWFVLAYMLAGTRSMSILYVGALVLTIPIVYPRFFKPKYYPLFFVALFVFFAMLSVISEVRDGALGDVSSSSEGLMYAAYSTILEMGASQLPLMISIDNFQFLEYSQTILYFLLLGFIPSAILDPLTPDNWHIQLGTWVNEVTNTTNNQLGFSWLAETYLNFGEFGWMFALLYGFFIAYAENGALNRIIQRKYLLSICLLSYLCRQIFFARAQIGLSIDFYRPIILIFIIWLITKKINNKSNESRNFSRRFWLSHK